MKYKKMKKEDLYRKLSEEDFFKKSYSKYSKFKKYVIISIRVLIALQTKVPEYIRISKNTICPYNGIQGKIGIDYLLCIFSKLNI